MKILEGIKKGIRLADYSTIKIGGRAKYLAEVSNLNQLKQLIKWAKDNHLPFFILGNGSNTLFDDNGFSGLIIKIKNDKILTEKKNSLLVGAGYLLNDLVRKGIEKGFTNYEWLNGIPGTIGGAVFGNAGAFSFQMQDLVLKVKTINPLSLKEKKYSNKDCKFKYRSSIFKENREIIWEVEILKKKGNKKEIKEKSLFYLKNKIEKKMFSYPSLGSIFKNVLISKTPYKRYFNSKKQEVIIKGEKIKAPQGKVSSGYFIEKCGLKGKRKNGAQIADFHANVIINLKKAKAKDVLYLINLIKEKVFKKYKIELQEEIVILKNS
ncbi:MAG TPA: UDP-N-acetylmuramate dehydrogenase [Candidatus Paceibacterota bacterium]|nr:UDP-N-acetylmuramate dehydrogenase [Candidatus Paceibacterota bacterium]